MSIYYLFRYPKVLRRYKKMPTSFLTTLKQLEVILIKHVKLNRSLDLKTVIMVDKGQPSKKKKIENEKRKKKD